METEKEGNVKSSSLPSLHEGQQAAPWPGVLDRCAHWESQLTRMLTHCPVSSFGFDPHYRLPVLALEKERKKKKKDMKRKKKKLGRRKTTYSLTSLCERSETPGTLDRRDWESQEANPLPRTGSTEEHDPTGANDW